MRWLQLVGTLFLGWSMPCMLLGAKPYQHLLAHVTIPSELAEKQLATLSRQAMQEHIRSLEQAKEELQRKMGEFPQDKKILLLMCDELDREREKIEKKLSHTCNLKTMVGLLAVPLLLLYFWRTYKAGAS